MNAPQCEWWKGSKKDEGSQCQNEATWEIVKRIKTQGTWKLCTQHKNALLESYNAEWRKKEEPEWKPIK